MSEWDEVVESLEARGLRPVAYHQAAACSSFDWVLICETRDGRPVEGVPYNGPRPSLPVAPPAPTAGVPL